MFTYQYHGGSAKLLPQVDPLELILPLPTRNNKPSPNFLPSPDSDQNSETTYWSTINRIIPSVRSGQTGYANRRLVYSTLLVYLLVICRNTSPLASYTTQNVLTATGISPKMFRASKFLNCTTRAPKTAGSSSLLWAAAGIGETTEIMLT